MSIKATSSGGRREGKRKGERKKGRKEGGKKERKKEGKELRANIPDEHRCTIFWQNISIPDSPIH